MNVIIYDYHYLNLTEKQARTKHNLKKGVLRFEHTGNIYLNPWSKYMPVICKYQHIENKWSIMLQDNVLNTH